MNHNNQETINQLRIRVQELSTTLDTAWSKFLEFKEDVEKYIEDDTQDTIRIEEKLHRIGLDQTNQSVELHDVNRNIDIIHDRLQTIEEWKDELPENSIGYSVLHSKMNEGLADMYEKIVCLQKDLEDTQEGTHESIQDLNNLFAALQQSCLVHLNSKAPKPSTPTSPSSCHSHHHPHHDQDGSHSQLSPSSGTHQNSTPKCHLRNSTHQFQLSDRTRFVCLDFSVAQGLLHVLVEEYS